MSYNLEDLRYDHFFLDIKTRGWAIGKLPPRFKTDIEDAAKQFVEGTGQRRQGFALQYPTPASWLKLQTALPVRKAFQNLYPLDEKLVFSFDVGQYVAPGETQHYTGLRGNFQTDNIMVALIALTEQSIGGEYKLSPGDVLFYAVNKINPKKLFLKNTSSHRWKGLFTSFWPLRYDSYGKYQREMMLYGGMYGLLFESQNKRVDPKQKPQDFLDRETLELLLNHQLVPDDKRLFFFSTKLQKVNCKYIDIGCRTSQEARPLSKKPPLYSGFMCTPEHRPYYYDRNADIVCSTNMEDDEEEEEEEELSQTAKRKFDEEEENDLLWSSSPRKAVKRLALEPLPPKKTEIDKEHLLDIIDKLYVAIFERNNEDRTASFTLKNLMIDSMIELPAMHSPLPSPAFRLVLKQRTEKGVTVCRDKEGSAPVLFMGTDEYEINNSEQIVRAFFVTENNRLIEVRSTSEFSPSDALKALSNYLCPKKGQQLRMSMQNPDKAHCGEYYFLDKERILPNERHLITVKKKEGGVECSMCKLQKEEKTYAKLFKEVKKDMYQWIKEPSSDKLVAITHAKRFFEKVSEKLMAEKTNTEMKEMSSMQLLQIQYFEAARVMKAVESFNRKDERRSKELDIRMEEYLTRAIQSMICMSRNPRYKEFYTNIKDTFFNAIFIDRDSSGFYRLMKKIVKLMEQ